ncbi:MAG: hypothetical protein AB8E82_17495 [Aureispira sp.]
MNDQSPLDKEQQITAKITQWCLYIITLAFVCQMGLSFNLWLPLDRHYPLFPLFPIRYPIGLTALFNGCFLLGLGLACFSAAWRKRALGVVLSCFFLLVIEDVNRFQPWAYVYVVILGSIAWQQWRSTAKNLVATLQFVVIMVYFWSGIHKLNVQFIHDVFPWLIGIFESTRWLREFPNIGYSMGLFEVVIALFLLWPKARKGAVVLGVCLHAIILLLLITDGWNSVVYPWNVAMMLLLYTLFWSPKPAASNISTQNLPYKLITVLFGFVPLLYLFHLAPNWIALSLYSGTTMECDLVVNKEGKSKCFPAVLEKEILDYGEQGLLSLDNWGMQNLNVPPLASDATYKEVGRQFCNCAIDYEGYIILYYPNRLENTDSTLVITCEELLQAKN